MTAGMPPSQSGMGSNGAIMPNPRSIYLGNVEPTTTYEELIDHISGGNLDSVRILPEKQCAFVTFLSPLAAKIFLEDITAHGLTIRNRQLKANWGKVTPVPADVERHVLQGATRAVFVGGTTDSMTEEFFRTDFERFGNVDTVKVLPDKKVAFIHFTSINYAIKAVAQLRTEERFKGHKIDYGRDRCNRMPRRSGGGLPPGIVSPLIDLPDGNAPAFRTVYLGNMDPETTPDELCAIVRGGAIDSIKMIPDKQHAFVAFVTADGASAFHAACTASPPVVRGRTLKVGWGKESPLPSEVAMLVRQGATRNVYVGQIDDTITPERLRQDFAPFGTLESVAIVREKKCAFVAFLSIQAAAKAIQTLKSDPTYAHFKLNYGKDNCARPPRTPGGGPNGAVNGAGANGHLGGANGNSAANGHYVPPYGAAMGGVRDSAASGLGMNGNNTGSNGIFGNSYYYQSDSPSFGSAYSSRASSPPPPAFGGVGTNGIGSNPAAQQQQSQQQPVPLHHPQHHQASLLASGQYGASAFSTGLFGSSSSSSPTLLAPSSSSSSSSSSGNGAGYLPSSLSGGSSASSPSSASAAFSFGSFLSQSGVSTNGTSSAGAAVSGTFGNSYGGAFAVERPSSGLGLSIADSSSSGSPSGTSSPVPMLSYGQSAFSMQSSYSSGSSGLFSGIGGSSSSSDYGIFSQSLGSLGVPSSTGLTSSLPSMTASQQQGGPSAFGSYDSSFGSYY